MRTIINPDSKNSTVVVNINELTTTELSENIIVYETNPTTGEEKGLGVLVQCDVGCSYCFVYHKTLLKGRYSSVSYNGSTSRKAISKAIAAKRKVYIFDSFQEFLDHAAKYARQY